MSDWMRMKSLVAATLAVAVFGGCADVGEAHVELGDDVTFAAQEAEGDATPTTAADAGTSQADASVPLWAQREDLGVGNGKDVVMIGDSWMAGALGFISGAYIGGIAAAIKNKGKNYPNYSISATQLLNGAIPRQYTQAKRANKDIKTVIMTGGGNDVLIGGKPCNTPETCAQTGAKIAGALNELWTQMAHDGVKDIVYIQYAASAGSSPASAREGGGTPAVPICTTGKIVCHSIPTTDIIPRSRLGTDGIHPDATGNRLIAERVLKTMGERKVRR